MITDNKAKRQDAEIHMKITKRRNKQQLNTRTKENRPSKGENDIAR